MSLKTLGRNFRFREYPTVWLTHLSLVLKQSGERLYESVLFTCEMEQFPSTMMLFQAFPALWWTCGTENTEISVKCESYFSTWLNWSRGGFCVQSIHLMGLLLLAVPKSTTNIYSVHCMWKICLSSIFLPNVWSLLNRKQNFVFTQRWRSSLFKALHGFCLLPPLNSLVSPSPAASPPAFVVVGWKAMSVPQPPGVDSDEEAVPRSPRVCLRAAASCSRLRPTLLCWICATPSRPPRERSSLT